MMTNKTSVASYTNKQKLDLISSLLIIMSLKKNDKISRFSVFFRCNTLLQYIKGIYLVDFAYQSSVAFDILFSRFIFQISKQIQNV